MICIIFPHPDLYFVCSFGRNMSDSSAFVNTFPILAGVGQPRFGKSNSSEKLWIMTGCVSLRADLLILVNLATHIFI